MEGSEALEEGSTRDAVPDTIDDVEVRFEDPERRLFVEGGGTEAERVEGPPVDPLGAIGGDGAGEGGGLALRRRDMSSLAVVRSDGA